MFEDVRFNNAEMSGVADHGNIFKDCRFEETTFRKAVVGYRGSAYQGCLFDGSEFRRSSFVRPEFDDCQFAHCRLKGVDFNASSFVHCSFAGVLEDVWFRGEFPMPSAAKQFGNPRRNEMKKVSFENAELHDLTFSDRCDLSSIVLPTRGDYRLYGSWKARLDRLGSLGERWSSRDRGEVQTFVYSYGVHAKKQDWWLINCEDVRKEYGQELGNQILQGLEL